MEEDGKGERGRRKRRGKEPGGGAGRGSPGLVGAGARAHRGGEADGGAPALAQRRWLAWPSSPREGGKTDVAAPLADRCELDLTAVRRNGQPFVSGGRLGRGPGQRRAGEAGWRFISAHPPSLSSCAPRGLDVEIGRRTTRGASSGGPISAAQRLQGARPELLTLSRASGEGARCRSGSRFRQALRCPERATTAPGSLARPETRPHLGRGGGARGPDEGGKRRAKEGCIADEEEGERKRWKRKRRR